MKVILTKNNGRYGFNVLSGSNLVYSSFLNYFITPFVKSDYKYAWEACRDARKMMSNKMHLDAILASAQDMEPRVIVDISAEEMLVDHYRTIIRNLGIKSKGASRGEEKDKKEAYDEIKMVLEELNIVYEKITDPNDKRRIHKLISRCNSLISKYFYKEEAKYNKSEKNASIKTDISDPTLISNIMEDYAEKICYTLQSIHSDAYYSICPDKKQITVTDFKNKDIIFIKLNDDLNIVSIIPSKNIQDDFPLSSFKFYTKYWKPVVESVGHFKLEKPSILVALNSSLPDVSQKDTCILNAWDVENDKDTKVSFKFYQDKSIWMIEKSTEQNIRQAKNTSKYTEQEYINSIVKCIDPTLKSVHGRTGSVIQIIPLEDVIFLDVDFGRGIGVARLSEDKIEIVHI